MTLLHHYVAFVAIDKGDLYRLCADGSEFTRLTTDIHISAADLPITAPVLSPDGEWLAFIAAPNHASDVYLIRPDGRELRRLSNIAGTKFDLHWSPDSRYLAFNNEMPAWESANYVVQASNRQVTLLGINHSFPRQPWFPDSTDILLNPDSRDDRSFLKCVWVPQGRSLLFSKHLQDGSVEGWLRNNTQLLIQESKSEILFLVDMKGMNPQPWATAVEKPRVVGVRPDGMVVAYQTHGGTTLHLHHLDEPNPMIISHDYPHSIYFGRLKWSPDGQHLAYTVHHQLPNHVHIATIADGSTLNLGRGTEPHWLPDGPHLTYSRVLHPHIYPSQPVRYDLATGTTTPLIEEIAEMELSPWYKMPR